MSVLVTILSCVTAFVSILVGGYFTLGWYLHSKGRAKFRAQNINYVELPSLYSQIRSKENFVFRQHRIVEKHGPVFGGMLLGKYTIFVTNPEIAQQVLSKEFTNFTNRRNFNFQDPIFNAFLSVVSDTEQWKRLRSIVTPTFSTGKLRRMKPRIDATITTLIANFEKTLQKSPIANVKELYGAFTMDTIMQVAFGIKVDSLHDTNNHIVQMAKKIFSTDIQLTQLIQFSLLLLVPRLMKFFGFRNEVMDYFKEFSLKVIKQKREELKRDEKSIGKANNFLEMLLEAEAEHEKLEAAAGNGEQPNGTEGTENPGKAVKFMSNDEMVSQCILFFIAAYDTTTSAISLASHFLAINPDIQQRLYDEIETNLAKLAAATDEPDNLDPVKLVTFEALSQFEYLSAVINETLRYYPPTFVERTASKDFRLETEDGSIVIDAKKGDLINFPVLSIHRDPTQYPDPLRFDPERFLAEEPTFHKYAYLPFGSGPRNCVARSLALLEAKMALLNVIHLYRLSPCEQTKIPVDFYNNGNILTPREITLKIEKR